MEIRPLHVGKYFPPPCAGVEAHIDTLLTALGTRVASTLIACGSAAQVGELQGRPYRAVAALSLGKVVSVDLSPDILWKVSRELSSGRANLLHIHAPNPWGDLAALAASRNIPVVMSWHSDIVRQERLLRLYRGVQRRVLRRADRIIVFTPMHYSGSQQLHQIDVSSKVEVVPMGIDVGRLAPGLQKPVSTAIERFIAGRRVVLTIGRHVYYKGYEHLIDAFSHVDANAMLVMVGTGPLSDSLRSRIAANGLADRILMTGEVSETELVSLLHRCDVFTLPSVERSEAFGIASAEAMACGKPTVVCQLDNGVNYLNLADVTSLVVPPREPRELAVALNRLLQDDDLRALTGQRARARIHLEFSVEAMAEHTLGIYEALLASRSLASAAVARKFVSNGAFAQSLERDQFRCPAAVA